MNKTLDPVEQAAGTDRAILVVDLDGTLCRSDTLHEAFLAEFGAHPAAALDLLRALPSGRAAFKSRLADRRVVPADHLPLNSAVLDIIKTARSEGRRVALVTAADQRQADEIASATGLFDEVHGSSGGRNLKGAEKAAFLREQFGDAGFDYIGDSAADLPVWRHARTAYIVDDPGTLRSSVEKVGTPVVEIRSVDASRYPLLKALRTHQWSKNLLLFVPMIAAHDVSAFVPTFFGFLAFCATASAVYVCNDLLDLAADRAHPRKRTRPFAAGDLSAATGIRLALALVLFALALGLLTESALFIVVLAAYFLLTTAYSLLLKKRLIIDVLTLAGLYTIRILAGAVASGIVLSPWILGLSIFLFLALASVKRQAELVDQINTGREAAGRAYEAEDLPVLLGIAIASAHAAVLVMALYISSSAVQVLYATPQLLWLVCPLLLYWLLRMIMQGHRGQMTDDPIVFAATDRVSQITIAMTAFVVALSTVG